MELDEEGHMAVAWCHRNFDAEGELQESLASSIPGLVNGTIYDAAQPWPEIILQRRAGLPAEAWALLRCRALGKDILVR
ncbi:hypothetical protein MesoLjLc_68870 [Mesorhizobium sp. L-8-10]|nr:hypothetical protein MesoLjLc_68870 [Mesorhizobium sp. L-8-10]